MQPSDTPSVGRYNAQVLFNGGTSFTVTEQINTIGDISVSGTSTDISFDTGTNTFRANQTSVKAMTFCATPQNLNIYTLDHNLIKIHSNVALTAGDKLLIEIEVFNN